MDNNFNYDIQSGTTENERYEFRYTPEDYRKIFKLANKKFKISAAVMTVLPLIISILLLIEYYTLYGAFTLIFAITYALLQIFRFADARRKQKERINKSDDDVDIYEIADDRITYSNYINGELANKSVIPCGDISSVTENDEFIQFLYENKIYSLKKSEIRPDSVLHVQFGNVKAKMKKQNKFTLIGTVISVFAVLAVSVAVNTIEIAENYFMSPSYWIYFIYLIAPIISIIYAIILKTKKYPYALNMVFGILMSIILIVCGSLQFFYTDYFGYSSNAAEAAEEKLGIEIPQSDYIYFDRDNYSQEENIKILYNSCFGYYGDITSFDYLTSVFEDSVWLDEIPDEFIDVIPDPEYYITDDHFILYNVDNGEINKIPTGNGENRMVLLTCYNYEYCYEISITEYTIKL